MCLGIFWESVIHENKLSGKVLKSLKKVVTLTKLLSFLLIIIKLVLMAFLNCRFLSSWLFPKMNACKKSKKHWLAQIDVPEMLFLSACENQYLQKWISLNQFTISFRLTLPFTIIAHLLYCLRWANFFQKKWKFYFYIYFTAFGINLGYLRKKIVHLNLVIIFIKTYP